MDILTNAFAFLTETVMGKTFIQEVTHPWRTCGEFFIHHALQVEAYAQRIVQAEMSLNDQETLLLRVACILHDIGKLENCENHAERGAAIANGWLAAQAILPVYRQRIVRLITDHSKKGQSDGDRLSDILKDADDLDEIGAISIFMASNWSERTNPDHFLALSHRLKTYEIPFCEQRMARLTTQTARSILQRKQDFIQKFIEELDFELTGTEHLYGGQTHAP